MSRQAALSPYVLHFPSSTATRTTALIEVAGREKVVRIGIFFTQVGQHRRSVYENLDGEIILADACKCELNWGSAGESWLSSLPESEHTLQARPFSVTRSVNCPINCHMISARQTEVA
jgi:hypothetical protein